MCAYLDFEEVDCINRALKQYENQVSGKASIKDIDKLLKIFPLEQQYVFGSGKPFNNFALRLKNLLKNALNVYCAQSPPDLDVALRILQYLP
jgi:hypothetical protein